jgi:hypothetical protein
MDEEEKRKSASANRQSMEGRAKKMLAPYKQSPRQRVLDSSAVSDGENLAGYRDGESYEMLKNAKASVGHVRDSPLSKAKEGVFPWIGNQANSDESPRYRKKMEEAYDKVKEKDLKRDGRPTGYDAALRKK